MKILSGATRNFLAWKQSDLKIERAAANKSFISSFVAKTPVSAIKTRMNYLIRLSRRITNALAVSHHFKK